jgi:hypothetical protein
MDQKQRTKIVNKFKEEKAKYKTLSTKEMIQKLRGHSILDISIAEEIIEKGANDWEILLKSGESISVKEIEALKYLFHACGPVKYTNKNWFPTIYSLKNTAEWFADIFAFWIMEEAPKQINNFLYPLVKRIKPKISTVGSLAENKGPLLATEVKFIFINKGKVFLIQKSEYDLDADQWDIPGETFIVDIPIDVDALREKAILNMKTYLEDIVEKSSYTGYYLVLGPVNGSTVSYVYIYKTNQVKNKSIDNWRIKDTSFLKDLSTVDTVSGIDTCVVRAKYLLSR